MKFGKTGKKYYLQIMLSFILFTVLLISLLSILLYSNYQNYSLKLINRSNQRVLKQISENMGKINEHSSIYMKSIFSNPSTTDLLYNKDYEILDHLNDIRALESLMIAHPYVDSIYVYNATNDIYHIIGDRSLIRKGMIYDSEIADLIKSDTYTNPIPRKIPYSDIEMNKMVDVYTYIMKGMKVYPSDKYFSVVVNIDSSAFFSDGLDKKGTNDSPGKIYSINTQGVITGSAEQGTFLKDISNKPYIQKIIQEKKDGYFITKDGNDKKLITYSKAPVSDWILVNEVPYSYIVSMLDRVKIITAIIIIANLIIGCVVAFFLSRSLYSPIDRLKRVIGEKEEEGIGELDMIAVHVQKMKYSMNKLQNLNRDALQYIKNGLLLSLLEDSVIEPKKMKDLFEQCDMKLSLEHPAVVFILRIDQYQKKYIERFTGDLQGLYKFALNNITLEILGKQFERCESIDPGKDYTVTIISLEGSEIQYEDIVEKLENCIREIQQYYYEFIQVPISGYISSIASNLYEVGEIYNEALELSNQRFLYGHGCIINREHYRTIQRENSLIDEEKIKAFTEYLKTSNHEGVVNAYHQIINEIKDTNYDNILFVANYLSSIMVNTVLLIEKNARLQLNIDFMEFNQNIAKCETLNEMNHIFESIFEKITKNMEQTSDNKSDNVVKKVNEYVDKNYMFETLCTADIAEYIGLSQRYLNRVYRQGAARSVSDYIKEVRLNQGAKLLIDTEDTIEEILGKIGWTTKEYFYLCFKKEFGITPGEYRIQQKK